jgi:hypothetical protein
VRSYDAELALTDSVTQLVQRTSGDARIKAIRLLGRLDNPKSAAFILRNFQLIVFPATTYEECCFPYQEVIEKHAKNNLMLQAYLATLSKDTLTEEDYKRLKYIFDSHNSSVRLYRTASYNILRNLVLADGVARNDYLLTYDSTAYESDGSLFSGLSDTSQFVRDRCARTIRQLRPETGNDTAVNYAYVGPDASFTGTWRNYFYNGEIYTSKSYEKGRLSGSSNEYFPNGRLLSSAFYQDNTLLEFRQFDQDGKLTLKKKAIPGLGAYETLRY